MITRRKLMGYAAAGAASAALASTGSGLLGQSLSPPAPPAPAPAPAPAESADGMELLLDHVMFVTYHNNTLLEEVHESWKKHQTGKTHIAPQQTDYRGVYYQSKSFYVEQLSTISGEYYWSNCVYVVLPQKYWGFYDKPAMVTRDMLIPSYGCGYQIVSPDFPTLNAKISKDVTYDGFTILVSPTLEASLKTMAGQKWKLPAGKIKVHEKLLHPYDIAVVNEKNKLIGPLFQSNFALKEYW